MSSDLWWRQCVPSSSSIVVPKLKVATMIAVMRDTEYWTKPTFLENFMSDWKKILGKNHIIQNFKDCDFDPIYEWHQREKEKKQMSTEEKKALKEEKMKQEEKYMWVIVDGVKKRKIEKTYTSKRHYYKYWKGCPNSWAKLERN